MSCRKPCPWSWIDMAHHPDSTRRRRPSEPAHSDPSPFSAHGVALPSQGVGIQSTTQQDSGPVMSETGCKAMNRYDTPTRPGRTPKTSPDPTHLDHVYVPDLASIYLLGRHIRAAIGDDLADQLGTLWNPDSRKLMASSERNDRFLASAKARDYDTRLQYFDAIHAALSAVQSQGHKD